MTGAWNPFHATLSSVVLIVQETAQTTTFAHKTRVIVLTKYVCTLKSAATMEILAQRTSAQMTKEDAGTKLVAETVNNATQIPTLQLVTSARRYHATTPIRAQSTRSSCPDLNVFTRHADALQKMIVASLANASPALSTQTDGNATTQELSVSAHSQATSAPRASVTQAPGSVCLRH